MATDDGVLRNPKSHIEDRMQITLTYDSTVVPAALKTALQSVVDELDSIILNPIVINLDIGWGEVNGSPITGNTLAAAGAKGYEVSYSQLVSALSAKATSTTDMTFLAGLPTADPNNGGTYFLSTAQEKALGLINPTTTEIDGSVGFSSTANWDFS